LGYGFVVADIIMGASLRIFGEGN